eukprot:4841900-Amphidinium_carterae.2
MAGVRPKCLECAGLVGGEGPGWIALLYTDSCTQLRTPDRLRSKCDSKQHILKGRICDQTGSIAFAQKPNWECDFLKVLESLDWELCCSVPGIGRQPTLHRSRAVEPSGYL